MHLATASPLSQLDLLVQPNEALLYRNTNDGYESPAVRDSFVCVDQNFAGDLAVGDMIWKLYCYEGLCYSRDGYERAGKITAIEVESGNLRISLDSGETFRPKSNMDTRGHHAPRYGYFKLNDPKAVIAEVAADDRAVWKGR